MEALAIWLIILGAMAQGGHVSTQRWLVKDDRILTGHEALVVQYWFRSAFLLLLIPFWGEWGTSAETNVRVFTIGVAGAIIANIWIQNSNAHARSYKHADVSVTEPIQTLTPGLVTVAGFIFHEFPSWQGYAGIALVTLGILKHTREGIPVSSSEFWRPFALFRLPSNYRALGETERGIALHKRNAVCWAYASAVGGAFGLPFDALIVRSGSVGFGYIIQGIVLALIFGGAGKRKKEPITERIKANFGPIMLLSICWTAMVLFTNTAFRLAPVAYIGSMKRLYLPFVLFFAFLFLREKKAKLRFGPVLVMTMGAILLALDGTMGRLVDRFEEFFR